MTAGTVFDRTRTPLTVWFTACWLFATQKDGISAQSLQRSLEIGSYPTAWAMLHRLRSVLVRPGRDRLSGTVEADETFIGGEEPGLRGGRARGKKVLTGIAVEVSAPKGIGRCRMEVLADASAESLNPFITGAVEPGSTVITDAWMGYHGLAASYVHERRSQRAARPAAKIPVSSARRAPGRLAGQAVAAGYSPGPGGRGPSAELPGRVRLPLQPPPRGEPRTGLLPGHGAGRLARPGQVPGPHRRQEAAPGPASTRLGTRAEP